MKGYSMRVYGRWVRWLRTRKNYKNYKWYPMPVGVRIFKFSLQTNEPTKFYTDLGLSPVVNAAPAESQTSDLPQTGSHESRNSPIRINGTVRSVLKEEYITGPSDMDPFGMGPFDMDPPFSMRLFGMGLRLFGMRPKGPYDPHGCDFMLTF